MNFRAWSVNLLFRFGSLTYLPAMQAPLKEKDFSKKNCIRLSPKVPHNKGFYTKKILDIHVFFLKIFYNFPNYFAFYPNIASILIE